MNILTGDIGGTHSRLELFEAGTGGLRSLATEKYKNVGFASFDALLSAFLQSHAGDTPVDAAGMAVAGPVANGHCRLTNLDWTLDAQALAGQFGFRHCYLLNDFAAIPYGVDALAGEDLVCLQAGRVVAQGLRAFVGAGTGLGQALSIPGKQGLRVLSSEAGHADFAPGSERQMALVAQLRSKLGPVSNESLLSGGGLVHIYLGLSVLGEGALEDAVDTNSSEAPAQIADAARCGEPLATKSVSCFFEMLGSYMGNLALQSLPYGGLYLAGGMVPKMIDLMDVEALLAAYRDKAKMQELLRDIPIHVILNEAVARFGAARYVLGMALA